jgi:hypothetical protein
MARQRFLRRNRAGAFEGSEPEFSKIPVLAGYMAGELQT